MIPTTSLHALLALAAALAPLQDSAQEFARTPAAETLPATLFQNGTIHLGDPDGTVVEALLVRDGRVVEYGPLAGFAERMQAEAWNVVDLGGGHAVPGLQDSHGRVEELGRRLEELDVSHCRDLESLQARFERAREERGESAWLLASGWNPEALPQAGDPILAMLSEEFPTNPIRILIGTEHLALLNRRALDLCGFLAEERLALPAGRVYRDEDDEPTGLIAGSAIRHVEKFLPAVTRAVRKERILLAQDMLLRNGITAVHDMGVRLESIDAYRDLIESGELKLRIVGYVNANAGIDPELLELLPIAADDGDRFSVPGIMVQADGILEDRGAAMIFDYADAPGQKGGFVLPDRDLRRLLATAVARGLQPAVHAVGDRANRAILDLIREITLVNPEAPKLRMRIEHALIVAPKDWPRFPELGVLPSMQPVYATGELVRKRLGDTRAEGLFAWREVAPGIGRLAFGSGFPARDADPRLGLFAARTHASGSEVIEGTEEGGTTRDARAALAGYTQGAAYAAHQDDRRGRLLTGYGADLTVFDRDPIHSKAHELLTSEILMTVINGEVVWKR